MGWKQQIPGTFGSKDLEFAGHPCDVQGALDLLKKCYESGVSLQDVLVAVDEFLRSKEAPAHHINKQCAKVREKFRGWLD